MATIPLPALHVNPPPDQMEGLQRMMALKQMMALQPGQIQAQQQGLQAGAMENQQRQQALTDQQAQTAAMHEWDGKDINALPGLVLKHGGSAQTVMSMKSSIIKQQQDAANLTKDQLANEKTKNDYFAQAIDNVKQLPPEQQPDAFQAAVSDAVQKGHLDPQQAQSLQYQNPQQLDILEKTLMGRSSVIEQGLKAQQTAEAQAKTGEATAQTNKINAEINPNNPSDPNIRKQKYEGILQKIQAGGTGDVTPNEMNFARAYEFGQRKTTTQSDTLGVTSNNVSVPSGLDAAIAASRRGAQPQGATPPSVPPTAPATQPAAPAAPSTGGTPIPNTPSAKSSLVDMIGQYKVNPMMMSRLMTKHPDVMAAVGQKYPDFNQTNYNAINSLITGYTSGKQSKEINAINTAMGHVKSLDDAVDGLNNGNMTILNKIGNAYGINVAGQTPAAAFKLIVHRVGPEISSAYIPTGGGVGERIADEKDFSSDLPPQTLHNNAAITVDLLRSKIGALENQYKNTVGRDDFTQKFITPQAQASLQKFAQKSGPMIYARDPQGKLHSAPAGTALPQGWKQENQ